MGIWRDGLRAWDLNERRGKRGKPAISRWKKNEIMRIEEGPALCTFRCLLSAHEPRERQHQTDSALWWSRTCKENGDSSCRGLSLKAVWPKSRPVRIGNAKIKSKRAKIGMALNQLDLEECLIKSPSNLCRRQLLKTSWEKTWRLWLCLIVETASSPPLII